MNSKHIRTAAGLSLILFTTSLMAAEPRLLSERVWHLGDNEVKNWPEAPAVAEGFSLKLPFVAEANETEKVLELTSRNVDDGRWVLRLNGKQVTKLRKIKDRGKSFHQLKPGTLIKGTNVLEVLHRKTTDDITIGGFTIHDESLKDMLGLETVTVEVSEKSTGKAFPARITVTDASGKLVQLYNAESLKTAVRNGVLYTLGKPAAMDLPPGDYRITAMHGTEYGLHEKRVTLKEGEPIKVSLSIGREVETPGFIAADTHIHTLTFSGHGDSSVQERMVTLAAEGVELAVATDHNHHTDFTPFEKEVGVSDKFTSVVGNEVTTRNGHFCSFPFPVGGALPEHNESDWVKLVSGIRAKGARVVILNHPRWPDIARGPFGKFGLNRESGERASGSAFHFDALELINSGTLQPDPFYICKDWFSLMNYGDRITAVGSSDSHTVGNIVGQGRTYVRSDETDVSKIDVDAACDRFVVGDTTISMGIVTDVSVNETYRTGDTITGGERLSVNLRVAAPSWVNPKKAYLFLNGVIVDEKEVTSGFPKKPTDQQIVFDRPMPERDAWMVCVIIGDDVKHPAWRTSHPYTFAATNPVYLNVDGSAKYDAPRKTAVALLEKAQGDKGQWERVLAEEDGIMVQMISEMRHRTEDPDKAAFDDRVRGLVEKRPVLQEFLRYLPKPKASPRSTPKAK